MTKIIVVSEEQYLRHHHHHRHRHQLKPSKEEVLQMCFSQGPVRTSQDSENNNKSSSQGPEEGEGAPCGFTKSRDRGGTSLEDKLASDKLMGLHRVPGETVGDSYNFVLDHGSRQGSSSSFSGYRPSLSLIAAGEKCILPIKFDPKSVLQQANSPSSAHKNGRRRTLKSSKCFLSHQPLLSHFGPHSHSEHDHSQSVQEHVLLTASKTEGSLYSVETTGGHIENVDGILPLDTWEYGQMRPITSPLLADPTQRCVISHLLDDTLQIDAINVTLKRGARPNPRREQTEAESDEGFKDEQPKRLTRRLRLKGDFQSPRCLFHVSGLGTVMVLRDGSLATLLGADGDLKLSEPFSVFSSQPFIADSEVIFWSAGQLKTREVGGESRSASLSSAKERKRLISDPATHLLVYLILCDQATGDFSLVTCKLSTAEHREVFRSRVKLNFPPIGASLVSAQSRLLIAAADHLYCYDAAGNQLDNCCQWINQAHDASLTIKAISVSSNQHRRPLACILYRRELQSSDGHLANHDEIPPAFEIHFYDLFNCLHLGTVPLAMAPLQTVDGDEIYDLSLTGAALYLPAQMGLIVIPIKVSRPTLSTMVGRLAVRPPMDCNSSLAKNVKLDSNPLKRRRLSYIAELDLLADELHAKSHEDDDDDNRGTNISNSVEKLMRLLAIGQRAYVPERIILKVVHLLLNAHIRAACVQRQISPLQHSKKVKRNSQKVISIVGENDAADHLTQEKSQITSSLNRLLALSFNEDFMVEELRGAAAHPPLLSIEEALYLLHYLIEQLESIDLKSIGGGGGDDHNHNPSLLNRMSLILASSSPESAAQSITANTGKKAKRSPKKAAKLQTSSQTANLNDNANESDPIHLLKSDSPLPFDAAMRWISSLLDGFLIVLLTSPPPQALSLLEKLNETLNGGSRHSRTSSQIHRQLGKLLSSSSSSAATLTGHQAERKSLITLQYRPNGPYTNYSVEMTEF